MRKTTILCFLLVMATLFGLALPQLSAYNLRTQYYFYADELTTAGSGHGYYQRDNCWIEWVVPAWNWGNPTIYTTIHSPYKTLQSSDTYIRLYVADQSNMQVYRPGLKSTHMSFYWTGLQHEEVLPIPYLPGLTEALGYPDWNYAMYSDYVAIPTYYGIKADKVSVLAFFEIIPAATWWNLHAVRCALGMQIYN